jgi:hypothetical protein
MIRQEGIEISHEKPIFLNASVSNKKRGHVEGKEVKPE